MRALDVPLPTMSRRIYKTLFVLTCCARPLFPAEATEEDSYVPQILLSFPDSPIENLSLSEPQALAIDPEGNVFVADTGNNRILRFDHLGNLELVLGSVGWEREQFDRPLDITVKTGLDLFVADYNNERIERYDLKLNYISTFTSEEGRSPSLQFGFPRGIDVSRHGELFICDGENNRVLKLDINGNPDLSFGDFNWGEGQLQEPVKVEVGPKDMVYISDRGLKQIVVFDYYGNFVMRFGQGKIDSPNGLTWSDKNRLYVTDSGRHSVLVYSSDHRLLFEWGAYGEKAGAFNVPVDVATYRDNVYVLDSYNNRIQVFKISETPGK